MSDIFTDDLLRKCIRLTLEFSAREMDAYVRNGIAVTGNHLRLLSVDQCAVDFLVAATMGDIDERLQKMQERKS